MWTIKDVDKIDADILAEISVKQRIESLLEDMNVEDIRVTTEFSLGSGGRRTGVLHASTLGSTRGRSLCGNYIMACGRELYYALMRAPSVDNWNVRTRRILDTGTAVHAQLQAYLGLVVGRSGGSETFTPEADIDPNKNPIAAPLDISGHTDGIYTVDTGVHKIRFGIEIKTINDVGYKATRSPHPEHIVQGTIYQKCLDLPVMLFVYYNKNDSSIAEYTQVYDHKVWDAIVAKIEYVVDHVLREQPPPKEVGWGCYQCKYSKVCKPPKNRGVSSSRAAQKFRRANAKV